MPRPLASRHLLPYRAIYDALRAGDPFLAQSAAPLHVNTSDAWLRAILHA
ncbi:hypothetical protein [Phytohabitans rumicis]|nr:hypothetical protein [Phytohabitans rumicis]